MKVQQRIPLDELRRLDRELARLAHGEGPMLVCLAECLAVFKEREWHKHMGCGAFGDFVVQYLQRSKSWGGQLARLGMRMRTLRKLRMAILRQEVPLSCAMKVAGVMQEEDEDLWLEAIRGQSARAVGELLRILPEAGEEDDEDDEDDEDVTLTRAATPLQLAWLRAAMIRLQGVAGVRLSRDDLTMATLAEVETTLLGRAPAGPGFDEAGQKAVLEARRLNRIARLEAERRAEPRLPRREETAAVEIPVPRDLRGVFTLMKAIGERLASLDLEIGRRAEVIWRAQGWKRLFYASEQQYAEERVGMSLRSVRARRSLARKCKVMPEIGKAVMSAKIGIVQAALIATVAEPGTAGAWVRRAEERTVKHLREEVDAAEAVGTTRPTTHAELASVVALERAVEGLDDPEAPPAPRQMSASLHRPTCVLRWRMKRSDRNKWCSLKQMYAGWGSPFGTFLDFVPIAIFAAHPLDPARAKCEFYDVGQRDRGCTSPVCSSRDCSAHDVRERSKGGTDDRWNLTGVDTTCHLELIHVLRSLKVSGRAPDQLDWEVGPADIGFRVAGRKLIRPGRRTTERRAAA